MSIILALAAAASISAAPPPHARPLPSPIRTGVADVSGFDRRDAMVTRVQAPACRTDNHTRWPEAGCLRAAGPGIRL